MTRNELNLASLQDLEDGKIASDFDAQLAVVMNDLHERPSVQKARELHLVLRLQPVLDDAGSCDFVEAEAEVFSRVPKHTRTLDRIKTDVQGRLIFMDSETQ